MRAIISVLTGAAVFALAPVAGAQKTPAPKKEPLQSERDGCFKNDNVTECRFTSKATFDSVLAKRAVLGVSLSPTGTKRDTLGVFISRVTPNGPAEKAGIVEGERIVSINGIDLRVNAADAEDDYAAGLPQRRLTREVERLAPGNPVNLRVYSGGRTRDVQVMLGKASDFRDYAGAFGALAPAMGGVWTRPNFDGMRMQLRDFPKIRMEEMQLPRMKYNDMTAPMIRMHELMPRMNELRDKMRIEHLAPGRYRLIGPDGERIFDGANSFSIGPDGVIILRSNKDKVKADVERTETEKAKKEEKKKN
jgi:hypothetical protein